MKYKVVAVMGTLFFLSVIQTAHAQTVTLRYGQIPSTIKTVSALQFYIAQRKVFFVREGVNLEMLPIEGGANNMMVALDRGTVDITRTATPYLIEAVRCSSRATEDSESLLMLCQIFSSSSAQSGGHGERRTKTRLSVMSVDSLPPTGLCAILRAARR